MNSTIVPVRNVKNDAAAPKTVCFAQNCANVMVGVRVQTKNLMSEVYSKIKSRRDGNCIERLYLAHSVKYIADSGCFSGQVSSYIYWRWYR